MTPEISAIASVAETGGPIAGVIVGFALAMWGVRSVIMPTLNRLHDRMDKLETKLDDAREKGREEHRKLSDKMNDVLRKIPDND